MHSAGRLRSECKDGLICVGETACLQQKNGSFVCVCYHDGEHPVNGKCDRKTVEQTKNHSTSSSNFRRTLEPSIETRIPVKVVDERYLRKYGSHQFKNITAGLGPGTSISSSQTFDWVIGICSILSLLLLLILGIYLIIRRKRLLPRFFTPTTKKKNGIQKNLLPVDRFVLNPTYDTTRFTSSDIHIRLGELMDSSLRILNSADIKIIQQIGQGCFGKVFKGELDGEFVAVKVMERKRDGCGLQSWEESVLKEVETMKSFSHPNILSLIGISLHSSPDGDPPWLLFEFMEHGDLATFLRSFDSKCFKMPKIGAPELRVLKEDEDKLLLGVSIESLLLNVVLQVAEGMTYLCSQHFVHRDLAARNCLVGRDLSVKVSDFGLSRDVYTSDYYKVGGSRLLPVRWMSPESLLYGRFSLESDIWAFGILLWEVYSFAKQPYYGHSNEEVVGLILDGVLLSPPPGTPDLIIRIMENCWKTEPRDRIKFNDIVTKLQTHLQQKMESSIHDEYELPRYFQKVDYMEVV